MDGHLRILQERIEAASIGSGRHVENASSAVAHKYAERTGDKIIHREEENLHACKNYSDVRHQLRMLSPVRKEGRKHIDRKQKTPKEQRAFLARPERGKFVIRRERTI